MICPWICINLHFNGRPPRDHDLLLAKVVFRSFMFWSSLSPFDNTNMQQDFWPSKYKKPKYWI